MLLDFIMKGVILHVLLEAIKNAKYCKMANASLVKIAENYKQLTITLNNNKIVNNQPYFSLIDKKNILMNICFYQTSIW